ncbi:MAG: cation transporter [Ruminococcus sp.]|nr:cation transporter [Ruminococcus sp.]
MKKTWKLRDLDCANCAAKMERAIGALNGVEKATVSFMTQKLTIEAADGADMDVILKEAIRCIKKVEPDCEVIVK